MYSNGFVVAVKVNGKTVEEKDNKVVMLFDTEYSLMLKNRNDRKAVAKVYIDGEEVTLKGKLILDANSSLNLERYINDMDNGPKFKFVPISNEKVEDKKDPEKGYVEVRFQLVKPTSTNFVIHEEHIWHKHHHWYDWDPRPYWVWHSPVTFSDYTIGYSGGSGCNGSLTSANNTNSASLTSFACSTNLDNCKTFNEARIEGNNLVEEAGATIKGSNSSQKFSYSYVGELESTETVIRFKLVGTKDETVVKEYTKTHCTKCGRKYGINDNFCAGCGEKK